MEDIRIPNLFDIYKASKMYIDRPATLLEVMTSKCSPDKMGQTTKILSDVIAKLDRHLLSQSSELPSADLYNMVKDFSQTVLQETKESDTLNKTSSSSAFLRFMKNKQISTVETFDSDIKKELKLEMKTMKNTMKKHEKLIVKLQKARKNCGRYYSKVRWYTLSMNNARDERDRHVQFITDDIWKPGRNLEKPRRNLEKTLKKKEELAENATLRYLALANEMERTQKDLRTMSRNMTQKLILHLSDRLESSLFFLKDLAETFLPTESLNTFKGRLDELNVQDFVRAMIVSEDHLVYSFTDVREFVNKHGICKVFPRGTLSSKNSDKGQAN